MAGSAFLTTVSGGFEGGVIDSSSPLGDRSGYLAVIVGVVQTDAMDSIAMGTFDPALLLSGGWDFNSAFVWNAVLEDAEMGDEEGEFSFLIDSASTAAGLFSIGLVVWILRGGAFMTALASGGSSLANR